MLSDVTNSFSAAKGVGYVRGGIRNILRLEGTAVFAVALIAYAQTGAGWVLFAILFLAPDLSFFGYLNGKETGAIVYNATHSYLVPLALLAGGLLAYPQLEPYALIWIAHIGIDRGIGYGLKYASGFNDTHLGLIGRQQDPRGGSAA
jgi:hypothetical protein